MALAGPLAVLVLRCRLARLDGEAAQLEGGKVDRTVASRGHFKGRAKNHPLAGGPRPQGLPQLASGRGRHSLRDLYELDHASAPPGGRFRWMMSTVLAAAIGSVAILTVIYGSADQREGADSILPALKRIGSGDLPEPKGPAIRKVAGLNWFTPKSDRLEVTSGASSTRFVIQEKLHQRRNGREYIHAKPYVRVLARLAPPPATAEIPAFNPVKLYANSAPISEGENEQTDAILSQDIEIRVVELLGGLLPIEDGERLEAGEVAEIVARAEDALRTPLADLTGAYAPDAQSRNARLDRDGPNTTVLARTPLGETEAVTDLEDGELTIVRVGRGESLSQILVRAGADRWQAKAMIEAAKSLFREKDLEAGNEVHITLVPSLTQQGVKEPARFSVFADGHVHKVTVTRGPSGEFEATDTPLGAEAVVRALVSDDSDALRSSSLYTAVYYALLQQQVPPDVIMEILRIHAYATDYRRRLRAGDQVELFFDVKDGQGSDNELGEMLYTAITSGGETSRFYRYRSADGSVDYFDDQGSNSKKFLMRRPVRGNDVRLTSGFGFRYHPLLGDRKMHTGVDWAAPTGTPILAAGNGVIEQSGRKGQYGNYIRIRHANGYQTAYGHMTRIAEGAHEGVKVRQGQIIGFVGSTGLSSGPHLHYEVLINSKFVNPMSIQVPNERQLDGKQLAEFQKERARIDELMRRAPVLTASKQLTDAR